MPSPLTLAETKDRLRIPELWRILDLPEKPGRSCRCPWREDHKPSFSVSDDGMLWNDFTTGQGGDSVDFLRLATGLSKRGACKRFIELAGGTAGQPVRSGPALLARPKPETRPLPTLPPIRRGTPEDLVALAALRNVHIEAIRVADCAELLRFGEWHGLPAWFIVDNGGRVAQARRMDGQPWTGGAKALTLPGSWASWPIGAGLGDYQTLCLVEGGPDCLAAVHFIVMEGRAAEVAPVAMLGAGQRIHAEALLLLAGKRVRIYAHADEPGKLAARRWKEQLEAVCCRVDAVDFSGLRKADGSPVNDLNDATEIHPDDAGELNGLLPE